MLEKKDSYHLFKSWYDSYFFDLMNTFRDFEGQSSQLYRLSHTLNHLKKTDVVESKCVSRTFTWVYPMVPLRELVSTAPAIKTSNGDPLWIGAQVLEQVRRHNFNNSYNNRSTQQCIPNNKRGNSSHRNTTTSIRLFCNKT